MKKLAVLFFALFVSYAFFNQEAEAIGITIKVELGKRTPEGNCGPGRGICSVTIGGTLRTAPGAKPETGVEVLDGTAELKDGKLYVSISKPLGENAKNERGSVSVTLDKPVVIDPAVSKQLGSAGLMLVPGTYELKGNTFVFNVKAPRDAASGQASGKM